MSQRKRKDNPRRAAKRQMNLVAAMVNRALRRGKCPDCGAALDNHHGHMSCPACEQDALSIPGYATLPA